MTEIFNPPNLQNLAERLIRDPSGAGRDVDQAIQVAFRKIDNTNDTVNGMPSGTVTVTGSMLRIATGLTTITNVTATIAASTAINEWLTVTLNTTGDSTGTFNVYVWKPTAAGDTTPIASTTARTVYWQARGTP